jgi:Uma2 family endonuclease
MLTSLLVFSPGQQPLELTKSDRLPTPKFLDLDLSVEQVFGWLKVG